MKLIKSKFEIIEQKPRAIAIPDDMEIGPAKVKQELIDAAYRQIELVGRVSHKSEDRITEDSSKKFVDNMIKLGHGATLEFGTVYLYFPIDYSDKSLYHRAMEYDKNPYSKVKIAFEENGHPIHIKNGYYITSNMRVLVENNWLDDLRYICGPTEFHEKRYCVKFICDRGILAEFTRHRSMSFMAESTRYCNYSKGKFNNELTYVIPSWMSIKEGGYTRDIEGIYKDNLALDYKDYTPAEWEFISMLINLEYSYFYFLNYKWKPQQARQILPNALKTELIMTGFVSDWEHFFELRDAPTAHPDAQALAMPLHKEFIKRNYI